MSYRVFNLLIMPIYVLLLNVVWFGKKYLDNIQLFIISTVISCFAMLVVGYVYAKIADVLKFHFIKEKAHLKPLLTKVLLHVILNVILHSTLFILYVGLSFLKYSIDGYKLIVVIVLSSVINISAILIYDSIIGFTRWKKMFVETEQLRTTYTISKLWNLKSQINPNFLFRNFDTLSELMDKDVLQAETYMDHMSKVYQYFLNKYEEQLVPLANEINFLQSYYYILKAWFGQSLHLIVDIENISGRKLPPFTLQTIFESALNRIQNQPINNLQFEIKEINTNTLQIRIEGYDVLTKPIDTEQELLIDNIIKKFKLLTKQPVRIVNGQDGQIIVLPLLSNKEVTAS